MTRQIICLKCAKRKPTKYMGEWWYRIQGKARGFKNGDFVCDLCNATIPRGTDCVAQSFGLDRDPPRSWEHEYLGEGPGVVDGTMRIITKEDDGSTKIEEIQPGELVNAEKLRMNMTTLTNTRNLFIILPPFVYS